MHQVKETTLVEMGGNITGEWAEIKGRELKRDFVFEKGLCKEKDFEREKKRV